MPLLADYAITPGVFDLTSYASDEVCRLHLSKIGEVMRSEGLVRDLRAGQWRALFAGGERAWHRRGKELVRKLASQGRLISCPPALAADPVDDQGWCEEALATHARLALTGGVVVTQPIKNAYRSEALVASVERLDSAAWWRNRSPSIRLARSLSAYRQHLDLILRCANSIQFIDPHLDPTLRRYGHFGSLLAGAGRRTPAPWIEIHRVCYEGSGPSRRILNINQIEQDFRRILAGGLQTAGLHADVFVWDDFHDRYLISNLIGISLPNGFDTSTDLNAATTWTRLGRDDSDDIQREFDPSVGRHTLHARFTVP